jgi:CheY-specific phosphatase CheX
MSDLHDNYIQQFAEAIKENLLEMAELECEISSPQEQNGTLVSKGLTVILGITGKRPGRIIIDTTRFTAKVLSQKFNDESSIDEQLILDSMAEFGNIVSGHTITKVNNLYKGLGLMLTPPSLFMGVNLKIISPKISADSVNISTSVGQIVVSVGFERGK